MSLSTRSDHAIHVRLSRCPVSTIIATYIFSYALHGEIRRTFFESRAISVRNRPRQRSCLGQQHTAHTAGELATSNRHVTAPARKPVKVAFSRHLSPGGGDRGRPLTKVREVEKPWRWRVARMRAGLGPLLSPYVGVLTVGVNQTGQSGNKSPVHQPRKMPRTQR